MKLLLFSDLHRDIVAASRLVHLARHVDVVVGAGDFANGHRGISDCIAMLREIQVPTVLVPGNNETTEELLKGCQAWPEATVLHGTGVEIGGQAFFGIGGRVPAPSYNSWSYDLSEAEAESLLVGCPKGVVLVSHSPPKGAADSSSPGVNLGSRAVREAVVRLKPRLVVCGHIHSCGGQTAFIGTTPVVNAGPSGVIYSLNCAE